MLEETLKTLKCVLNLDEGVAALARSKDTELKAFLEPFETASPSNWSTTPPRNGVGWDLQPKCTFRQQLDRWTSAEVHGFESWVCSLTSSLARESPDPVLKACSALSAMRVDMAVFLFPYAVESILRKPDDENTEEIDDTKEATATQDLSRAVKAVNQGVRFVLTGTTNDALENHVAASTGKFQATEASSQPPQVVQLVVHTINFLRETEKARFVETNGRTQKKLEQVKEKAPSDHPLVLQQGSPTRMIWRMTAWLTWTFFRLQGLPYELTCRIQLCSTWKCGWKNVMGKNHFAVVVG